MNWVWTWGGRSFGYFDGADLWTHDGKHVGRRQGDEIYGPDGAYLGEVMNEDRLITHQGKHSWRSGSFAPYAKRAPYVNYVNYVGYIMYVGHTDFPPPDSF